MNEHEKLMKAIHSLAYTEGALETLLIKLKDDKDTKEVIRLLHKIKADFDIILA